MGLQKELELQQEIEYLQEQKNTVYSERNAVVAAFARLCRAIGVPVGLKEDEHGEPGFRMVCYIDLPSGQVSWHIHDEDLHFFEGIPPYRKEWNGHQTGEKYEQLCHLRWWMSSANWTWHDARRIPLEHSPYV
jgi:hypothetical protein